MAKDRDRDRDRGRKRHSRSRSRDKGRKRGKDKGRKKRSRSSSSSSGSSSSSSGDRRRRRKGGTAPDLIPKQARELFFGNLPVGVTENMLSEFVNEAMHQGELAIAPGPPAVNVRLNNNFAFIEFRSIEEASNALNMHGITLMNNDINVQRPQSYRQSYGKVSTTWPHHVLLLKERKPELRHEVFIGMRVAIPGLPGPGLPVGVGGATLVAAPAQPGPLSSTVLELSNMAVASDVRTQEGYQELLQDTGQELSRQYGKVQEIKIPQPEEGAPDDQEVRIYVQFIEPQTAARALKGLSGRFYAGKNIEARYYPLAQFNELST